MKYALGNMLNGAGSLNPDGLSLDLQFATDKTLAARKGPTPVFTRGSTATFVGSDGLIQSAAINAARFDHDPLTLACKGLLIEEARTNLVLQSENHPSASWNKTGVTVASASNTAPNGDATSNLVTEDLSVGQHRLFQSTAYVSGTSYAISVFLKYAGRQFVAIAHPTVAANGVAIFDIQNGTISLTQSGVTASITAYPNGWYRCVVNGVSATTGGSSHIIQGSTTGNSLTGSYLGLNGPAFYIYGSQIEAGAFPTSYIPTVASSVVRSADVCSITGSDFTTVYNEPEHTLFAEASGMSHAGFPSYLSFDNSTSAEQSALAGYPSTNRVVCAEVDGGTTFASVLIAVTLNQNNKMAATMKLNSFQLAVNNVLGTEDTSGTMATANSLKIGRAWNSAVLTGTYKQVKVFKKRLSNAKLQALTA
jgi:hypothetical protein